MKKIQAGYQAQPLSAYLKKPAPAAAPEVAWPKIDKKLAETEPLAYVGFLLQFYPTIGPAEVESRCGLDLRGSDSTPASHSLSTS